MALPGPAGTTQPNGAGPGGVLYLDRPVAAVAALVALGAAAFCFVTSENLPIGLLQVISTSIHSSVSSIGLLVTAYAAVVVVGSAPLTHLAQRLPRRALVCGLLGAFVLGTLAAGAAPGYWWLLLARVLAAMAQAVFWSVAAVTGISLFPPEVQGRAVAGVLGGGTLAVVIGVPAGAWLGEQGGWRLPFFVLSGVGVVILVAVALLLPAYHPSDTHAGLATDPSRRRFYALIATTMLVIGGFFTLDTYVSTFVTHVSHLAAHDVAIALFAGGVGGLAGVTAAGTWHDRLPRAATIAPPAVMTGALWGLFVAGTVPVAAVALLGAAGFAVGGVVVANQNRIMVVAPGSTDVASAWSSAAFNVGIAGGSLMGGIVVPALGIHQTALVGALLAMAGLAVITFDVAASPAPVGAR
jgi:predicted MFS family arabinose efflux permease